MPDNIECPDRITRHSEVALASFVEIADDLPVTGHRLSRTVRDTDAARSMVEVFAVARFCAMELITILNRCHRFRGFVYHRARFTSDHKSIEISVRPRKRSAAICSRCHQYAPGYDQLPERRFEFIPLWGSVGSGGPRLTSNKEVIPASGRVILRFPSIRLSAIGGCG